VTESNTPHFDTVCLYHGNCTDGFMSMYLFHRYADKRLTESNIGYFPINYDRVIPSFTCDSVYVLDYCLDEEQEKELNERNVRVVEVLDHHETAAQRFATEDSSGYGKCYRTCSSHKGVSHFTYLLQKENSGCGMTLSKFFLDSLTEEEIYTAKCVEDRDLWKFELSDSKAIHLMLNSLGFDYERWKTVLTDKSVYFSKLEEAKNKQQAFEEVYKNLASKAQTISFAGYSSVKIINCPSQYASYVSEILYQDLNVDFVISYVCSSSDLYVSLRSNSKKENSVRVGQIAKMYGGGGHDHAAGISGLTISDLPSLYNNSLKLKE
jgi:oligoribonuclease NrnB/cAMP/cGMP phosphodiesterase (DHH superfamily)